MTRVPTAIEVKRLEPEGSGVAEIGSKAVPNVQDLIRLQLRNPEPRFLQSRFKNPFVWLLRPDVLGAPHFSFLLKDSLFFFNDLADPSKK